MNKHWFKLVNVLTLCLISYQLLLIWWPHKKLLLTRFDYQQADFVYQHSQYNLDNAEFFGNIDDDLLHQYAGYNYIHGSDPSTINFEVPPLGKYLYGLSIYLFGNAYWIQFIYALLLLTASWYLAKKLISPSWLANLVPLLLVTDKLYQDQTLHTLLDLPQALVLVLTLIFFHRYSLHHQLKYLIFTGVFLGLIASFKLWITAALVAIVLILFLIKPNRRTISYLLIPTLFTFLAGYLVFFIRHPNPLNFFSLQLNVIKLYRSYLPQYPWGQILNIILFGRWLTWWGLGTVRVAEWSILWPLSFLGTIVAFIISIWHHYRPLLLASSIVLAYLFSNLFHVVFPRYLMTILPFVYICLLYSLVEAFNYVYRHRRQRSQHQPKGR